MEIYFKSPGHYQTEDPPSFCRDFVKRVLKENAGFTLAVFILF
jgi:hypothetical protein